MKIISKEQAKLLGLNRYFTGKKCKNDNIAERKMNSQCCCNECINQYNSYMREWNAKNRDLYMAIRKRGYAKNKEITLKRNSDWKKKNNNKINEINANRKALQNSSIPSWYGEFDDLIISEAYDLAKIREKATGIRWEIDHMIPLKAKEACGLHCGANIQVIPKKLNASKRNKMKLTEPFQWIK